MGSGLILRHLGYHVFVMVVYAMYQERIILGYSENDRRLFFY